MRWSSEDAVRIITSRLREVLKRTGDGGVSFVNVGALHTCAAMLAKNASFSPEVPHRARYRFARAAAINSVRDDNLDPQGVLLRIKQAQASYLRLPMRRLILLTSLSLRHDSRLRPLTHRGATIRFHDRRPRRFRGPASEFGPRIESPPLGYCWVTVSLLGRDHEGAAQQAFDSLDFIRGVWNLFLAYRTWRSSSGAPQAINPIVPGPFHTIHKPRGAAAANNYWWEPFFSSAKSPATLIQRGGSPIKFLSRVRKVVCRGDFGERLERLIVRYTRALDERNLSASLLKLWGVLEELTDTRHKGQQHTTKRGAFVSGRQHRYARLALEFVGGERNRFAHDGTENDDVEDNLQELKEHIDTLLMFIIYNPRLQTSFVDLGELLDLPPDLSFLRAIQRRLRWARRVANVT